MLEAFLRPKIMTKKIKMTPQMRQEYAQYTAELAGRQLESDMYREAFGLPTVDLALNKVLERESWRMEGLTVE